MARATSLKPRVTVEQLRILLEAVESDPSMYNASKSDMIAFLNIQKWIDLADKLNESVGGAQINAQNWKYVLRYWSDNTKKKMKLSKERLELRKPNPTITAEEAKELGNLEKRLFDFMKKEEAREIADVTYMGKFGAEPKPDNTDDSPDSDEGVKVVVQLLNVFPAKPDENTSPDGPKKRTIVMKEDDLTDPAEITKKFKVIFDQNVDEGEPQKQILENQLDRLQLVSRELEEHISTIQSRIHMIKDLWKHRCGDN